MQTTAAKNNLFILASPMLRQAIIKSGVLHAASDELASRLAAIAEQFYLSRAIEPLTETAELLISLPDLRARAAGRFYLAVCSYRQGDFAGAICQLEAVSRIKAAPRFQARALQGLGIIHRHAGSRSQAIDFYNRAIRQASASADLSTLINATINRSEIASSDGEYERALAQLQEIRPAVELAARVVPFYAPLIANEIAYELSHLRRFEEARRYAQFAISSPFARAYPEWAETAQEIEKQRERKPAQNRNVRPAVEQAPRISTKPKLRLVKKSCPIALPASMRRRTGPELIIRPEPPRSRPILEQICLKIRIRAPSF